VLQFAGTDEEAYAEWVYGMPQPGEFAEANEQGGAPVNRITSLLLAGTTAKPERPRQIFAKRNQVSQAKPRDPSGA
jgi:hypothetical protein